jgi:hypothetical protein
METRKLQEADSGWLISINQGNLNRAGLANPGYLSFHLALIALWF